MKAIVLFCIIFSSTIIAQQPYSKSKKPISFLEAKYQKAFDTLYSNLSDKVDFLNAVLTVENAYLDSEVNVMYYRNIVKSLTSISERYSKTYTLDFMSVY